MERQALAFIRNYWYAEYHDGTSEYDCRWVPVLAKLAVDRAVRHDESFEDFCDAITPVLKGSNLLVSVVADWCDDMKAAIRNQMV
jgi:hypothetical protein